MFDKHSKAMEICSACPSLCQSVCPAYLNESNKSYSPWGMMQNFNRIRKDELPFTKEVANLAYHCVTCKACTEQCEHKVDIPSVVQDVRIESLKQELAPPEIMHFSETFHRHNNPYSIDLLQKLRQIVPKEFFNNSASTIYYPSCTAIAKAPEIIQDTFSLFKKLKITDISVYTDPIQCCGYPLLSTGAEYEFVDLAEINFHSLDKYKLIVTTCPSCAYTLKKTYTDYHFDLSQKVVTISQFLDNVLKKTKPKTIKAINKAMYHDPCHLSRYLDESELPREIMTRVSGQTPIEFFDNKRNTVCCGYGGCYSVTSDTAKGIATKRLTECLEKNIPTLVTQCPTCTYKMQEASDQLKVMDIVSYVHKCLNDGETQSS